MLTAILIGLGVGATVFSVGAITTASKDSSSRPNNTTINLDKSYNDYSKNTNVKINTTNTRKVDSHNTTTNETKEELNTEELLNSIRNIFEEQEMKEALNILDKELAKFE